MNLLCRLCLLLGLNSFLFLILSILTAEASRTGTGWNYGGFLKCSLNQVIHTTNHNLSSADVSKFSVAFQACGVVALADVIPVADVDLVHEAVEADLADLLTFRNDFTQSITSVVHSIDLINEIWSNNCDIRQDPFLFTGNFYKERHNGRIDLQAPLEWPYTQPSFILNHNILPLLASLLGSDL